MAESGGSKEAAVPKLPMEHSVSLLGNWTPNKSDKPKHEIMISVVVRNDLMPEDRVTSLLSVVQKLHGSVPGGYLSEMVEALFVAQPEHVSYMLTAIESELETGRWDDIRDLYPRVITGLVRAGSNVAYLEYSKYRENLPKTVGRLLKSYAHMMPDAGKVLGCSEDAAKDFSKAATTYFNQSICGSVRVFERAKFVLEGLDLSSFKTTHYPVGPRELLEVISFKLFGLLPLSQRLRFLTDKSAAF